MPGSFERANQFHRKLQLLKTLDQSRMGMTMEELHRSVQNWMGSEFSRKTLQRDLKFLQEAGYPVDCYKTPDPSRRTVWKMEKNPDIRLVDPQENETLSITELLSFYAARQLLLPLAGTPFWDGIQSMWRKVQEQMPPAVWTHLEAELPNWLIRGPLEKNYEAKSGKISSLNSACLTNRKTQLTYQKSGEGETTRIVHPYTIVMQSNQIVLIAVEPEDDPEKYKHFKLDRIVAVKPLDKRFKPRSDFDPGEHFKYSLGLFRGSEPQTFRIRFAQSRAGWVRETPFHSKEIIEELADGSLVVEIQGYEEELVPRILGQGNEAEILSPESARQQIRNMTLNLTEMYHATPAV